MYVTPGQVFTQEEFEQIFPIIDPSELIGHYILKHEPQTKQQEWLKNMILEGIDQKLPAFRVPCMTPSEENGRIVFKAGNKPAIKHPPAWWQDTWKDFLPSKNSRMGTDLHYAAFLGKLLKYLTEEELYIKGKYYSAADRWEDICDDSTDLGHYFDFGVPSRNVLEPTGSRKVGIFFDLANTYKILENSRSSDILIAGGHYLNTGCGAPLASMCTLDWPPRISWHREVGWLVMDP